MSARLSLLYRDVDRLPYLCPLVRTAKDHDLEIELVRHKQVGPEDWGEKLKRGEVDALAENYWGLQRFRAAGAPFVTVASSTHNWVEWLLVRSEAINSIQDLRGKKFAVRDHGPQRSLPTIAFGRLGLLDDIEQVVVEERDLGRWGVWKAVADGRCDACYMTPAYADAPLAAGLRRIPNPDFPFEGGHIIPTTTEGFVAKNPEAVSALVRALFDTSRRVRAEPTWALDVVRSDCLEDLREHFTLNNEAEVARLVTLLNGEVSQPSLPTLAGLVNGLEIAKAQYEGLDAFNPLVMWDLSFARQALAG